MTRFAKKTRFAYANESNFKLAGLEIDEVETQHLILRRIHENDTASLHQCYSDPDVMKLMPGGVKSLEASTQSVIRKIDHWHQRGFGLWSVVEKLSGIVIGHCGLVWSDHQGGVEVGYLIAKEHWNKGFVTSAVRASLAVGFESMGVNRIFAVASPENIASRRIMEKVGMVNLGEKSLPSYPLIQYGITTDAYYKFNQK
jgi:RimJ/RimL family protein N-acetyltransferase